MNACARLITRRHREAKGGDIVIALEVAGARGVIREKLGQGEAIVVISHHRTILKKKNERYKNVYLPMGRRCH